MGDGDGDLGEGDDVVLVAAPLVGGRGCPLGAVVRIYAP